MCRIDQEQQDGWNAFGLAANRYRSVLLKRRLFLVSLAATSCSCTLSLVWACQKAWPGSPLFAVLGFLARLAGLLFGIVVGLVAALFSGRATVLKAFGSLMSEGDWSKILCPLVIALFVSWFVTRIFRIARMRDEFWSRGLIVVGVVLLISLIAGAAGNFAEWARLLDNLL
jgi:hypothetical protein